MNDAFEATNDQGEEMPVPHDFLSDLHISSGDIERGRKIMTDPSFQMSGSSHAQAEHMAQFAGVTLDLDEVSLYCALREQMSHSENDKEAETAEESHGFSQLSDQKLIAAILYQSGDQSRFEKFISAYPNIFKSAERNQT